MMIASNGIETMLKKTLSLSLNLCLLFPFVMFMLESITDPLEESFFSSWYLFWLQYTGIDLYFVFFDIPSIGCILIYSMLIPFELRPVFAMGTRQSSFKIQYFQYFRSIVSGRCWCVRYNSIQESIVARSFLCFLLFVLLALWEIVMTIISICLYGPIGLF